jgi:predicted GNAT family N-acyltransferase
MIYENDLVKAYKVKFDLTIWEDVKTVWLNKIIIPKSCRKNHLGSMIMEDFIKWLDLNHFTGELLVSNCYGTPENILIAFYERFGFKTYKRKGSKNIYMHRVK